MAWECLGPDLYLYHDCCQVYALRDGHRALLIDLGSGACLDALDEIGVDEVAGVFFTHAHRDQCQGAPLAAARGIPLHFAARAREMIDPELRQDYRRLSPCHLAYPSRFHPPQPIPEAIYDLAHWQIHPFGAFDLQVIEAPCHLDHHLVFRIDGPAGLTLFSGDAMHSAGKVHEAYCLETDHYTGNGARQAADVLCQLRNLRPERLCPSHGPVLTTGIWEAFELTVDRLRRLGDLKDTILPQRPPVQRLVRMHLGAMHRISDHLYLWGNSYFLLSDDGPILMVDVQTQLPDSFHALYRETFGERLIEVVLVTHIHCDHVMGIEELRRHHPLECWALEHLVGGIERPYELARPWLHNEPTRVDRPLAEGRPVHWHEYELTPYWFPGQTDLHAAYTLEVDGHRAMITGDNFYPAQQWGGTGGLCGFNGGHPALWRKSAELVLAHEPEWLLASHLQPHRYRREDFRTVVAWTEEVTRAMQALAPDGNLERHHSPHFLHAFPYVQPLGKLNAVKVSVTNTYPHPLMLAVAPVLPAGIGGDGEPRELVLAPGETAALDFVFQADPGLAGMHLVTFEVTANGEPWGQMVECYLRGPGQYEGDKPAR